MATADLSSTIISWWGAGLSTLLATVKLWELWRDRFQLDVSYNFRGDAALGNDILIRNLSGRPILVSHWELLYCTGRWPRRNFDFVEMAEPDAGDCRIEPYSSYTLHFTDERHFSWGHNALNGRSIYICLYVAGRKPNLLKVYPS